MVVTSGTVWKKICLNFRSLTVSEPRLQLSLWSSRRELYQTQVATKFLSILREEILRFSLISIFLLIVVLYCIVASAYASDLSRDDK